MSPEELAKRTEPVRSRRDKIERRKNSAADYPGDDRRKLDRRDRIADRRTENNLMLATFYLSGHFFGIFVNQVQEILLSQKMTPVPLMAEHFKGLMNLRGQIVPAIDLRKRMKFEDSRNGSQDVNLIVNSKYGLFSFVVDRVGDVLEIDPDYYEPPPMNIDSRLAPYVKGICKLKSQLLIVLNVDALVG